MTQFRNVDVASVTVGQEVCVWHVEDGHQTYGQGGVVTATAPQFVIRAAGIDHTYDLAEFGATLMVEVEEPTPASECLNYSAECGGPVELFDPSGRGHVFPRCAVHRDQRAEAYQNSIEPYAHSDVVPSWFDPTYAGESWD